MLDPDPKDPLPLPPPPPLPPDPARKRSPVLPPRPLGPQHRVRRCPRRSAWAEAAWRRRRGRRRRRNRRLPGRCGGRGAGRSRRRQRQRRCRGGGGGDGGGGWARRGAACGGGERGKHKGLTCQCVVPYTLRVRARMSCTHKSFHSASIFSPASPHLITPFPTDGYPFPLCSASLAYFVVVWARSLVPTIRPPFSKHPCNPPSSPDPPLAACIRPPPWLSAPPHRPPPAAPQTHPACVRA